MISLHVLVSIPIDPRRAKRTTREKLHVTHSPLEHPPRQQATAPEILRLLAIQTIALTRRFALTSNVSHLRHSELHFSGQLVARHPCCEGILETSLIHVEPVHRLQKLMGVGLYLR